MRVFLTGISGHLGSVVARHLAEVRQVESITGVDWLPPHGPMPNKVRYAQLDVRSPTLVSIMVDHDVVVHTAFIGMWRSRMTEAERGDINLNGTRNTANCARVNKVKRFIHASSVAAYDPSVRPEDGVVREDAALDRGTDSFFFTRDKAEAERIVEEAFDTTRTRWTIFRPTYIVGPCNGQLMACLRANARLVPGNDPSGQWVHEEDVAAAFVHAVLHEMPGAYNVAPDDTIKMSEAQKLLGIEKVRNSPAWLRRAESNYRWRFKHDPMHPAWLEEMWREDGRIFSNEKLKETGWRPRFTSEEALRDAMWG